MKSCSLNPQVALYTSHASTVHTWEQNGRCTVQDPTATGRVGYPYGTSLRDKASYTGRCNPENRHMTGGGTPAGNGALGTVRQTTNTVNN